LVSVDSGWSPDFLKCAIFLNGKTMKIRKPPKENEVRNLLYEPVPWKEAQKCWQELLDGKYEWSSIGKQLREKGLVK
jgi:hypothetical protein